MRSPSKIQVLPLQKQKMSRLPPKSSNYEHYVKTAHLMRSSFAQPLHALIQ